MSDPVLLRRDGRVATVTLDRPPLHILDVATLAALDRALAEIEDDDTLQLVVLSATGDRAFCAGVAVEDHLPERVAEMLATFHGALRRLAGLPAVTLAVVRGHCLGGGLELAATCDLVLAADDARFGQPEVELGCFPPWGAALYPPRLGAGRTLELLVTGRRASAEEAERLGLVHRRVAAAELDAAVRELIVAITSKSAAVTRLIKRAVAAGATLPFPEALTASERLYLDELARSEDMTEGIRAFLDKRPPAWRHR